MCNTDESRVKENRNVFIIYHYFDGVTKKFIFLVLVLETGNFKKNFYRVGGRGCCLFDWLGGFGLVFVSHL